MKPSTVISITRAVIVLMWLALVADNTWAYGLSLIALWKFASICLVGGLGALTVILFGMKVYP